ncbi:MAG: molybdopterin-dependent oxidoreductase [Alphaproteobacteria bacterium]|nr:molybdopterin-dependent oxidoreductase [Alphaproteobacteria bacterium]
MTSKFLSRRRLLTAGAVGVGALALGGLNRFLIAPNYLQILESAEGLTLRAQRAMLAGQPLAREFSEADLSPIFKANGTVLPDTAACEALMANDFADWRLTIDGMVTTPASLSMADLKRLPQRTQITRHDCVEGWSAIGKWTGVPLGPLLQTAGLAPNARFVVFHCADDLGGGANGLYYESVDLVDAFHPQTILAHTMNDAPLKVAHGAPLRLRVERQLGYKHAKYLMRIEVVESLANIGRGNGGFWEDRGYEWYAGI